jgi:hypothetical protein
MIECPKAERAPRQMTELIVEFIHAHALRTDDKATSVLTAYRSYIGPCVGPKSFLRVWSDCRCRLLWTT